MYTKTKKFYILKGKSLKVHSKKLIIKTEVILKFI